MQFTKFQQLLKDAILLNDRLRKYTEKRLPLYADRSSDCSNSVTMIDSSELPSTEDADSDNEYTTSVPNVSSRNCNDKPSERRTVRIAAASQSHQLHSLSSQTASLYAAESSSLISKQESIKMQVSFEHVPYVFD